MQQLVEKLALDFFCDISFSAKLLKIDLWLHKLLCFYNFD
jgi:hypothetical protein